MEKIEGRAQRRAAANRQLIIETARDIVVSRGADALTLEEVAARADVAVQTIYNRVGPRSAVLAAIAGQAMRENREYMDTTGRSCGSALEQLIQRLGDYTRFARERTHEFQILVNPPNDPTLLVQIDDLIREQNAHVAQLLRDAIAEGSLRDDLDPDLVATTMWATMNGLLALHWRPDTLRVDDQQLDALVATYLETVTNGLHTNGTKQ